MTKRESMRYADLAYTVKWIRDRLNEEKVAYVRRRLGEQSERADWFKAVIESCEEAEACLSRCQTDETTPADGVGVDISKSDLRRLVGILSRPPHSRFPATAPGREASSRHRALLAALRAALEDAK